RFPQLTGRDDGGNTSLESGVTLDWGVGFEPEFELQARFSDSFVDTPEYIRAVARGTFNVTASAAYDLNASASYSFEKTLFERSYGFVYSIGGVPVYQDVTLEIIAELDLAVDGELHASAEYTASKEVALGFEWDVDDGFEGFREDGFEQEVTFALDSQATASGTLKVYPALRTSLYKAAEVSLAVEPTLNLERSEERRVGKEG